MRKFKILQNEELRSFRGYQASATLILIVRGKVLQAISRPQNTLLLFIF